MANISVFTTTATSIEVIVSYLDTSNPEKRLEFFVDGSYDGYMDVNAVAVAGIGVDYVYTGLGSGYEYNLRVDVYVWDQFGGWVIETSASVRGTTDGGGGGGGDDPEPPDEWDYQIKDTYNDISDNITVTEHISPGYLLRYKISFAESGTATFYSTGSTLAPYGALSDSSRFDYTNGVPRDLLEDDGDQNVGENFSFTYDVEAGETYYFWVGGFKLSSYGNLTIHIDPPGGGGGEDTGPWTAYAYRLNPITVTQPHDNYGDYIEQGRVCMFEVTFENSGTATFYSDADSDPVCYLSTSTAINSETGAPDDILASHDDISWPSNPNFRLVYNNIVAGETYYVWVRFNGVDDYGSMTLYIDPPEGPVITPTYTYSHTNNSVTFSVQNRGSYYMRFYVRYNGSSTAKVYDSEEVEGGYVAQDSYTVTGLSPGTSYAVNVYYATTRYNPSDGTAIGAQYFTTGGSSIALWDWDASNGSATATQTQLAYTAITSHGSLSDFSYKVWNDLCNKVNDAIVAKGRSWSSSSGYLTYDNTLMTTSDKELTAARFNTLRYQIGRFIETTGITNRSRGDTVYGWYFVDLADYLNDLINSI